MAKMTPNEYRQSIIKTSSGIFKLCVFLGITNLEIIDINVWKDNNDYNYKIREINPYNPLSYVLILLLLPIGFSFCLFYEDSYDKVKRLFKYR